MTIVAHAPRAQQTSIDSAPVREIRIAVLGLGQVGGAVAALAARASGALPATFDVIAALVRDPQKSRAIDAASLPLTTDPRTALASKPDVLVEVLGGIEPARTLVVEALNAGIPVVTANKTLLAYCGAELFAVAAAAGVPLGRRQLRRGPCRRPAGRLRRTGPVERRRGRRRRREALRAAQAPGGFRRPSRTDRQDRHRGYGGA
jgi:hypothetical protein